MMVKKNSIFIALKGSNYDGREFLMCVNNELY